MTFFPIIKRITTRAEYDAAQVVILEIAEAVESGDASRRDELDLLLLLAKDYEAAKPSAPGPKPKSHEMLEFCMEQHALRQADLVNLLGISRSAVSSILAGRIAIPRAAAQKLKKRFGYDFPTAVALEAAERPVRSRNTRRAAQSAKKS